MENWLKRKAFCETKLRGVNWFMKTIANHAITYKNKVKYSGDINLQMIIYFLPNNIKPNPRMIQKENAKAVLITIGFPITFEIIPDMKIIL